MTLSQVQKFIVAVIGAIGVAVAQGVLPEDVNKYVAVAVAFLTAIGVYAVRNNGTSTP